MREYPSDLDFFAEHPLLFQIAWSRFSTHKEAPALPGTATKAMRDEMTTAAAETMNYLVWSNEHGAWWGPNEAGYCTTIAAAGRYTREEALGICIGARGGRRYNENPSEVPVLLEDAVLFWPDDKPEWRVERQRYQA